MKAWTDANNNNRNKARVKRVRLGNTLDLSYYRTENTVTINMLSLGDFKVSKHSNKFAQIFLFC